MKPISNYRTKLIILLSVVGLGIIIDQITKFYARQAFELYQVKTIIDDFFYLTYTINTGGAWSIFSGNVILLGFVSGILCSGVVYTIFKKNFNFLTILSLSLIVSGGIGNIIDRFLAQGVTDFIGFYIFSYAFPIFNFADIFVVSGAIGIVLVSLLDEYKKYKEKQHD